MTGVDQTTFTETGCETRLPGGCEYFVAAQSILAMYFGLAAQGDEGDPLVAIEL